jgi:hypothetical protein
MLSKTGTYAGIPMAAVGMFTFTQGLVGYYGADKFGPPVPGDESGDSLFLAVFQNPAVAAWSRLRPSCARAPRLTVYVSPTFAEVSQCCAVVFRSRMFQLESGCEGGFGGNMGRWFWEAGGVRRRLESNVRADEVKREHTLHAGRS